MCTCIEDLYWAEIRVPLGPAVLLGVGALLVYRLWRSVAAVVEGDDEPVLSDSESDDEETDDDAADDDEADDDAADDDEADDADADYGDAVLFDPSAEDPDAETAALTVIPWDASGSEVPNPEIFPADDTEYGVSLIDAPTPGPALVAPGVISSTEAASSDAAPPSSETDGTPSGSSPPGDA